MASYRTSAAGGSTSGSANRTATITPAVGDLFVVFCGVSGNTNTAPTCSDNNGGSYDLITTAQKNTSADTMSAFVRTTLLSNTTSTVVTVATGSNTAGAVHVYAIRQAAKSGLAAIVQSARQENQAAAGTPAPAFSSSASVVNVTLGAVFNATNPAGLTAPTNWTERQDTGFNTPSTGLESVNRDATFSGTTITWGSTSASAFSSIIIEIDSDNEGIGTATVPDVTSGGTGSVAVTGTGAATVSAVTSGGVGDVAIVGTGAATLDAVTVAATGTVSSGEATGTLDVTVDAVTSGGVGDVAVVGTGAATLDAVTSGGVGAVDVSGTSSVTVDAVTASGVGAVDVAGTLAATVSAVTVGGVGAVDVAGSLAATLDAVTVSGSGTVLDGGTGTLSVTLDAVTSAGQGDVAVVGTVAAEVAAVSVAGSAAVDIAGTGAATIDSVTLAGTGGVSSGDVTGSLSVSVDAVTVAALGDIAVVGVGAATVAAVVVAGVGARFGRSYTPRTDRRSRGIHVPPEPVRSPRDRARRLAKGLPV